MQWHGQKLTEDTIRSRLERPCRVRGRIPLEVRCDHAVIETEIHGTDVCLFETERGKNYVLTPSQ